MIDPTHRPGCPAWHADGEVCTHPRLERDYDERHEADEGRAHFVDSEADSTRERSR